MADGGPQAVVGNYRDAGIRFFVLARAIRNRRELDGLRTTLPMPLRVVRLSVPWGEIERRLGSDIATGRQDDLRDAATWTAAAEGADFEDVSVANDRALREVAIEVLEWLGWT